MRSIRCRAKHAYHGYLGLSRTDRRRVRRTAMRAWRQWREWPWHPVTVVSALWAHAEVAVAHIDAFAADAAMTRLRQAIKTWEGTS